VDKKPLKNCIIVSIIFLSVSTTCLPVFASEGTPDLIITGVTYHSIIADIPCLFCIVKNNGTTSASDFTIQAFGGRFLFHEKNIYKNEGLAPGESVEEILFTTGLYFGIYRLYLHISTNTTEENTSNNNFSHSYFIISSTLLHVWVFKELPW
jgi:hypothetical protein